MESRVYAAPPNGESEQPLPHAERFLLLAVQRGSRVSPMHSALKLRDGDVVSVAVYRDEREAAHDALQELGLGTPAPA